MGPEADFEHFVQARSPALLRSAWLLTGDWARAEDLVQVALVKTWLSWPKISRRGAVEAYTRTALVRSFLSWRRKRSSREIPSPLRDDALGISDGVADRVEQHILVVRLLRALPPRQRIVLVLRFFDDLTEGQTAEAMGTSVGTVKSQTAKALAQLRRQSEHLTNIKTKA